MDDAPTHSNPSADHDAPSPHPHERETEDERLLQSVEDIRTIGKDAWRVFRIMGEFVEGFEEMGDIGTAVSIFGSARTKPDDPMLETVSVPPLVSSRAWPSGW